MAPKIEFSRTVVIEPWPGHDIAFEIAADAGERQALAARFDLLTLDTLTARGRLTRHGTELRLSAAVAAELTQRCVVSLEPVPARLAVSVERQFVLEPAPVADPQIDPLAEIDLEPLSGTSLDLGELIAEELGLALDPYPRRDDAEARIADRLGPSASFGEGAERPLAGLRQLYDNAKN